eukprot:m.223665 g.223665  ORF g.223665 m.223665 type:complete len:227 (+) comp16293_c0_seq1:43-723(+)
MPPKKQAEKEPSGKKAEKDENVAAGIIYDYLLKQNRPYNANDICTNLHEQVGKAALVKALTILVTENKIKEKTYGKQKIYFVDQSGFAKSDPAELSKMDEEIDGLKRKADELVASNEAVDKELKALESEPGTDEAKREIAILLEENARLKEKLQRLQSSEALISPAERDRIFKQYESNVKEWKRRKRMATEITDAILDNFPKSKKLLFEEIGLVPDEEANVDIKSF